MSAVDIDAAHQSRLSPLPWRSFAAGGTASLLVVVVVTVLVGDDPLRGYLLYPGLALMWWAVAWVALRGLGSDRRLAISAFGGTLGGLCVLDIPYFAGSGGWNVAILLAGACGPALAEWVLRLPSAFKWILGGAIIALGISLVSVVSDEVNEQRVKEAIGETPTPYTVDSPGWTVVDVVRVPIGHTSVVSLRVANEGGVDTSVDVTTIGGHRDASVLCRSKGDVCSRLRVQIWAALPDHEVSLYRAIDGLVVSMEFDRRRISLETATAAISTLRLLTNEELQKLGY